MTTSKVVDKAVAVFERLVPAGSIRKSFNKKDGSISTTDAAKLLRDLKYLDQNIDLGNVSGEPGVKTYLTASDLWTESKEIDDLYALVQRLEKRPQSKRTSALIKVAKEMIDNGGIHALTERLSESSQKVARLTKEVSVQAKMIVDYRTLLSDERRTSADVHHELLEAKKEVERLSQVLKNAVSSYHSELNAMDEDLFRAANRTDKERLLHCIAVLVVTVIITSIAQNLVF
jgi:hypothetical protein